MTEDDIEYLVEALHTNLTAVAEEVGAIERQKSDELETLGAILSGPAGRQKALEEGGKDDAAGVAEQFAESVELSLQIADAADVSESKLEGSAQGKTYPGLKALGDSLGGRR